MNADKEDKEDKEKPPSKNEQKREEANPRQ
jgi:hypothetical protein